MLTDLWYYCDKRLGVVAWLLPVISTASSLRRPVSGVSGGSAASCSGDDSPVVVSMVWSTRVSRSLRVQHVLCVVDRVIDSIGLF
ncbi:unnamed protein product [Brassica rapa subsp. narinosa]|uniref:(rape) hypothetical protein n=2 Tax=Brassica napus TaxID=3708 RepID=A0A816X8K5_BRANA|nr:unnamed protein product [Brassica napus]